jgi:hypothetical protein
MIGVPGPADSNAAQNRNSHVATSRRQHECAGSTGLQLLRLCRVGQRADSMRGHRDDAPDRAETAKTVRNPILIRHKAPTRASGAGAASLDRRRCINVLRRRRKLRARRGCLSMCSFSVRTIGEACIA